MLGEAGEGAEVRTAKLGDLRGFPADETVARGHRLQNPGVHRKSLQSARSEEQHAVGDFFAHAGEFKQAGLGRGVGERLGLVEPAGARSESACGFGNVARAKSELAGAELGFGNGGEFGPGGQAVDLM